MRWDSLSAAKRWADSDASKHLSTLIASYKLACVEMLCRGWGAVLSANRGNVKKLAMPETGLFLLMLLYLIVTSDYIPKLLKL